MNKLKDLLEKMEEKKREEVEKTIDEGLKRIDCEKVDWRNFEIYPSSAPMMENILKKMEIHFLLPIAEEVKQDRERNVKIIVNVTKDKQDDIWFIRVDTTKLLASIECSPRTVKYLEAK